MNYQNLTSANTYRYFRFFYLIGALLPVLILISSILCFFSHKKLNQVIKTSFLIGFFVYFIYAVSFHSNSVLKLFFIVLGFSILYTNMFMLLYKLILRVKNKFFAAGLFCGFFPLLKLVMLLTSSLLAQETALRGKIISYCTSILFIGLFILYSFITKDELTEKQVNYKNFSIRFFVYLINIFKKYSIVKIFFYLLICGTIDGLIQQYLLYYVVFSDNAYFNVFYFFQIVVYAILFLSIILISAYVNKNKYIFIFSCSSILLFVNIIFILIFGEAYFLNEFLVANFTWYYSFFFFFVIAVYISKHNYYKFNIVLTLGFVSFLFGLIISEWVNVWFTSNYITLLLVLCLITFLYIRIRDNREE
ncbi:MULTISPECIES: hypothetical protein [Francisella]|nr:MULTISPECIES: hypothetical protein [Francisella]